MKNLLDKIKHIGIDETVAVSDIKYIILVNALSLISVFLCLGFIIVVILYLPATTDRLVNIYCFVGAICLISAALLINHYKYHLIARIYFDFLGILIFSTFALLNGVDINQHLYLILVIIVSFFLFSKNERKIMYFFIFWALANIIGLEIWFLNHKPILSYSEEGLKALAIIENMGLVAMISGFAFYIYTIYQEAEHNLELERRKSENLLHNILPVKIADRLKINTDTIADKFENTSILFADLVDFTTFSDKIFPEKIVQILNEIFTKFDYLAEKYNLEKIKTIGDAYMVAAGLPLHREDHAEAIAEFALDMLETFKKCKTEDGKTLRVRVGINSGPVVAGVIGKKKFIYDLWGDTVNTAARMESHGIAGEIQVTQMTYELLKEKYIFTERGYIDVKGKGQMKTYLLKGRKL
jgi:class 3 adenylate cyclase